MQAMNNAVNQPMQQQNILQNIMFNTGTDGTGRVRVLNTIFSLSGQVNFMVPNPTLSFQQVLQDTSSLRFTQVERVQILLKIYALLSGKPEIQGEFFQLFIYNPL